MLQFLLDMSVSPSLRKVLEARGHAAVHANEVGLSSAADQTLLIRARERNEVLITADLDYPRLLALAGAAAPSVILFRGGQYSEAEMVQLLVRVLDELAPDQLLHSMIVVDQHRIRRRSLPI